jgi:putative copper export protein
MTVLTATPSTPVRRDRRRALVIVVALTAVLVAVTATVVGLVATGAVPRSAPAGLQDAGRVTGWATSLSRLALDGAAIATIGALLVALLTPRVRRRMLGIARRCALAWLLAAVASAVSSVSSLTGTPLLTTLHSSSGYAVLVRLPQGRALGLIALVAGGIVWSVGRDRSRRATWVYLVASLAALGALVETGHAATTSHHYLASQALVVHVLAASVWVGGLVMTLTCLRGVELREALPRFSAVALGCYVAVAFSGVVGACLRLGITPEAWRSSYGLVLVVKVALVVGMGVAGYWHRSRGIAAAAEGRRRVFARVAGLEVLLMSVAVGLGVALSRAAVPDEAVGRVRPAHAAAAPTIDAGLPAPSLRSFLLHTSPDALVVVGAVSLLAAGAVVLARTRPARLRGAGRLAVGALLAAWALGGGLASYSATLPQVQVAQLLVLALVAPPLLLSGWKALVPDADWDWGSPVRGLVALLAVLVVVSSSLLDQSLGSTLLHQALAVAALGSGLLLLGPALVGQQAAAVNETRTLLLVLATVLVTQGGLVLSGGSDVAGPWFANLRLPWADPAADQQQAGQLLLGAGVCLVLLSGLLGRVGRQRSVDGDGGNRVAVPSDDAGSRTSRP